MNGEAADLLRICDDRDGTDLELVRLFRVILACGTYPNLGEAGRLRPITIGTTTGISSVRLYSAEVAYRIRIAWAGSPVVTSHDSSDTGLIRTSRYHAGA